MSSLVSFFMKESDKIQIRKQFFIRYGQGKPDDYQYKRNELNKAIGGQTVKILTDDKIELDAVWASSKKLNSAAVIIFHGTGDTVNDMRPVTEWFYEKGLSVLSITMRGYPGSGGDSVKSGEKGLYLDVAAAVRFVLEGKKVPKNKVMLYGYSLGSSLAAAGSLFFNLPVTLDHPFTSSMDIAKYKEISRWEFVVNGAIKGSFESHIKQKVRILGKDVEMTTDALNTLKKVRNISKKVFVIYGLKDTITPSFMGKRLLTAKYKNQKDIDVNSIVLKGGHTDHFYTNTDASNKLENFIKRLFAEDYKAQIGIWSLMGWKSK